MAIYVYNTATGALASWCPDDSDPVADSATLAANGLASVSGLPALGASAGAGQVYAWNAATRTVAAVAAPVTPNWIPTYEYILLFTPAEHAAIQASTDQRVQQFLMALSVAQQVDLNSATIQNGIAYLVSLNLLTQANATLILSGQPSQ